MAELIRLENITKSYDDNEVLKDITISIQEKEFVTLLGPSGCGKTTTLRILGGFESPDSGRVLFDGKNITNLPPNERNLNTVFQSYALFPHMTVGDNVAFGLRVKGMTEKEVKEKVHYGLKLVNLEEYQNRRISQLSGGQQQRVAMARAIVNEPKVLLLDEPLGALDLKLRQEMQYELVRLKNELGITFIYVTHDQEEALTMSDKVIVMNNGHIQQEGTPEEIYNEPENAFVADFIGDSNILSGKMIEDHLVRIHDVDFPCIDGSENGFYPGMDVDVLIRPEDLEIRSAGDGILDAKITSKLFIGMHYEMLAKADRKDAFEWLLQNYDSYEVGTVVGLYVRPENIQIMHKPKTQEEEAIEIDI